jgi:putative Ca2+/H+ antiporter (TMEM165/GDT1 family)
MACVLSFDFPNWLERVRLSSELVEWYTAAVSTFTLISLAEIGDKSQLVCMTLAARHRTAPVVLGASVAFALLNLAAVLFGAAVARWVPEYVVGGAVVLLFTAFGLRASLTKEEVHEAAAVRKSAHGIFVTTFLLIFAAEFGDKTQLAVAGMSAAIPPTPVWVGATLALIMTSALGVWAGRALLQHIPLHWLHRLSGVLFLAFAAFAAWHLVPQEWISRFVRYLQDRLSGYGLS